MQPVSALVRSGEGSCGLGRVRILRVPKLLLKCSNTKVLIISLWFHDVLLNYSSAVDLYKLWGEMQ